MTNPSQKKGQLVYAYPDIWPDCPIDVPTDLAMAAGEIYGVPTKAAPVALGIAPHNHVDNDTGAMWFKGHYVIRKGAGEAFAWGAPFTLELVVGTDYYEATPADTQSQVIYGYCMRAADAADTTMVVWFKGQGPWEVVP